METSIMVRPAARAGKYLGPDAANSNHCSAIAAVIDIFSLEVVDACFVNAGTATDAGPPDLMNPIGRSAPFASQ